MFILNREQRRREEGRSLQEMLSRLMFQLSKKRDAISLKQIYIEGLGATKLDLEGPVTAPA